MSRSNSPTRVCAKPTTAARKSTKRRTAGVGVEQAAAIAVEISRERRAEEVRPLQVIEPTIEGRKVNEQERSTNSFDTNEEER